MSRGCINKNCKMGAAGSSPAAPTAVTKGKYNMDKMRKIETSTLEEFIELITATRCNTVHIDVRGSDMSSIKRTIKAFIKDGAYNDRSNKLVEVILEMPLIKRKDAIPAGQLDKIFEANGLYIKRG